ncbi:MAG TPA: radical SAM protein [Anaerolineae bacterium]|nr:radical SAM protein [Anaerolineae bacterium]
MLLSGALGTTRLTGSLKPGSLVVMFDSEDVLTYDRAGRLWSRRVNGRTFRRGLDGRLMEKWPEHGRRQRRWLTSLQAAGLLDESAARMRDLVEQTTAGRVAWTIAPEDGEWLRVLERAARFDARAAEHDRDRFADVYSPIGMLPPDQYLALVLQATAGCSFNTCTFCNFYAGERFRIKSPQVFREHVRAVRAYLGDSLALRRSIFLSEANALTIPYDRLMPLLEIARAEFDGWPLYAFLDAFSGRKKSIDEYRQLAAAGLKRVSLGLESGHPPLLKFVRKPGAARDALETVSTLKAAGIAVSLIVLIGLGGDRYADLHVSDTIDALNAMPLTKGDIIYFSDLVEHADTAYPALARAAGIRALTIGELNAQRQAIRAGLRYGPGGPIISKYDIGEFVY